MNYLLTITDPLQTGQRRRRVHQFVVAATSEAAVIPTFQLTHWVWMTPGAQVDVAPYTHAVVQLHLH
jgi:hypothetical protein